jgi:hypothetical protein
MPPIKVRFGPRQVDFPGDHLAELRDANALLDDPSALRQRMAEDGYLYLRELIPRQAVLAARAAIMQHMAEQEALVPGRPVLEGAMPRGGKGVPMMGRKHITHSPDVLAVLENPRLFDFFAQYFDEPARTFDYKWLRAVGNEGYTGSHYDVVYMGRGSQRLHTAWIPLGDIAVQQGTLAINVGSNHAPGFETVRQTYGRMDVDRDGTDGWFATDPQQITDNYGGQWATANFQAGDVVIFGMFTMHCSTTNTTDRFRLSCDVRYQPASDPVDERWVDQQPPGHMR